MKTTAERLQYLMDIRGLKQVDILKMVEPYCKKYKIKLGKSDLSQFVSGKVKPGQSKLSILGMALNVSEGWLMGLPVPMERTDESAALDDESGAVDLIDYQIADLILSLTPEKKEEALHYLQYLADRK